MIFKEFQRLEENAKLAPGVGLGLSIVERIGRVIKAPVGIRSETRSRVDVLGVAAARLRPADTGRGATGAGGRFHQRTGDAVCRQRTGGAGGHARALLKGWGCVVHCADSSETALAITALAGTTPDVILADYQLDTDTGLDAVSRVRRQLGRNVPGVIITANHSPEVQKQVQAMGLALLHASR